MKYSEKAENELQGIINKDDKKVYTGFRNFSEIRVGEEEFTKAKDHVVDSFQKH